MPPHSLPRRETGRISVLVATPLGEGGRGGIDRIVDEVRHQVARMPAEDVAVGFLTTRGPGHILFAPLYFGACLLQLLAMWSTRRADVLHVNLSSHGSTLRKLLICRLARMLSVPYVVHLHGSRFRQFYQARGRFGARQITGMFQHAARVVVLGTVWRDFVLGLAPTLASRVEILPNATHFPPAVRERPGDGVIILFLGEVGKRKGVPQLVEALQRIDPLPGWTAVIAGNGEVEHTRGELARRGLAERVRLTGWVGPDEVEALLETADMLVLPSFDENLPMSVIEGMGHALAVVTTPVGAVTDIIKDGETGLLVPPGDVDRLAEALTRLVTDSGLRLRLGTHARAFHRTHLNIEAYVPRLMQIWRMAANERQAGAVGAAL